MLEAVETGDGHPAHLEAGHVVADALGGIGQQVAKHCSQRGQRVALRLRKGLKMRSDRILCTAHGAVLLPAAKARSRAVTLDAPHGNSPKNATVMRREW